MMDIIDTKILMKMLQKIGAFFHKLGQKQKNLTRGKTKKRLHDYFLARGLEMRWFNINDFLVFLFVCVH